MAARGLSEADVEAALKTYTPHGQEGRVPHLRVGWALGAGLRHRGPVDAPAQDDRRVHAGALARLRLRRREQQDPRRRRCRARTRSRWGDVHHPALSETSGDYDGQFLFVNDKANGRIAVVDLADFMTKQIVVDPLVGSDHGGAFVTPNTDYVIEGSQYPTPLGRDYAPLSDYKAKYRGLVMFWKFDRKKGRIVPRAELGHRAAAVLAGPVRRRQARQRRLGVHQLVQHRDGHGRDAAGQAGHRERRLAERHGLPPHHRLEEGRAARRGRQGDDHQGAQGDPAADGGGRGRPHASSASPRARTAATSRPTARPSSSRASSTRTPRSTTSPRSRRSSRTRSSRARTPSACPILAFKDAIRGQVEVGLGPLHTQFDDNGNAYTSLFLESKVAKWSVKDLKLLEKLSVHYNIGHILAAEGDTVSPDGKYVVAMNKMSIDRFTAGRPALPAELPAHRHHRRQDAPALRPADRQRRAALRPDDQGGQAAPEQDVHAGRLRSVHRGRTIRTPSRAARSASRATATRSTST